MVEVHHRARDQHECGHIGLRSCPTRPVREVNSRQNFFGRQPIRRNYPFRRPSPVARRPSPVARRPSPVARRPEGPAVRAAGTASTAAVCCAVRCRTRLRCATLWMRWRCDHRGSSDGRLAQRESVRLTRGRSLVRSQYRPPARLSCSMIFNRLSGWSVPLRPSSDPPVVSASSSASSGSRSSLRRPVSRRRRARRANHPGVRRCRHLRWPAEP